MEVSGANESGESGGGVSSGDDTSCQSIALTCLTACRQHARRQRARKRAHTRNSRRRACVRVCKKQEDLAVGLHLLIFGANAEVVNIVCLSVVSPESHHDKAQSKVCGHLSIHNACLRGDSGRRASASEWCKPASTVSPTDSFAAPLSSFACHITEVEQHSSNRGVAET